MPMRHAYTLTSQVSASAKETVLSLLTVDQHTRPSAAAALQRHEWLARATQAISIAGSDPKSGPASVGMLQEGAAAESAASSLCESFQVTIRGCECG
mgnify:CR=1 FL=1